MEIEVTGNILIIKLVNQPGNALDYDLMKSLYQQLGRAEKNKQIKGVLLCSGSQSIFSSGLDLRKIFDMGTFFKQFQIIKAVNMVYRIVKRIVRSKKIYIAAVSGSVIGSALSIVMACDFRFACKNAWFWVPDPLYGGLLADGGIDLLKHICGVDNAKKICLMNKRFDAHTAKEMALINEIIEAEPYIEKAQNYLTELLSYSYPTLRHTKLLINRSILKPFPILHLFCVVCSKEMRIRIEQLLKHPNDNTKEKH